MEVAKVPILVQKRAGKAAKVTAVKVILLLICLAGLRKTGEMSVKKLKVGSIKSVAVVAGQKKSIPIAGPVKEFQRTRLKLCLKCPSQKFEKCANGKDLSKIGVTSPEAALNLRQEYMFREEENNKFLFICAHIYCNNNNHGYGTV